MTVIIMCASAESPHRKRRLCGESALGAAGVDGGLDPRPRVPSASRLSSTPTQALYMSVNSVSIFSAMHCTIRSFSSCFCSGVLA